MFLLTFLINIIEFDYCIAYRQYKYMIYLLILHFYFILLSWKPVFYFFITHLIKFPSFPFLLIKIYIRVNLKDYVHDWHCYRNRILL